MAQQVSRNVRKFSELHTLDVLKCRVSLTGGSLIRFMADHDAWRELAEIYVSLQM